jgi:glycosyltransferase involved in cell wall biosynthesis
MLVQEKTSDDATVHCGNTPIEQLYAALVPRVEVHVNRLLKRRDAGVWSNPWIPNPMQPRRVASLQSDIVHFHWLGRGCFPMRQLRHIDRALVWTLHDMWAFTGGCHITGDCSRFQQQCGECPKLKLGGKYDLSHINWSFKRRHLRQADVTFTAPSRWLAERARSSSLLADKRVEVIPNGLDTSRFSPLERNEARQKLGLSLDQKVVLYGAASALTDHNKGFDLLEKAMRRLFSSPDFDALLCVFGASGDERATDPGGPIRFLDYLNDQQLQLAYSAADVMVVPSRQEAFGLTAIEAMSCATPVVAFDLGGPRDIVLHEETGFLATPFDTEELACGIEYCLKAERLGSLSAAARTRAVREYDMKHVARQFEALYEELVETRVAT